MTGPAGNGAASAGQGPGTGPAGNPRAPGGRWRQGPPDSSGKGKGGAAHLPDNDFLQKVVSAVVGQLGGGQAGNGRQRSRGPRVSDTDARWACERCGFKYNFDSRSSCFKCSQPRPQIAGLPSTQALPGGPTAAGGAAKAAPRGGPSGTHMGPNLGAPAGQALPVGTAAPASPTPAERLALAKKRLEAAKAWPAEGDEKDTLIIKAQAELGAAQVEFNATRPVGAQLKSAQDKVDSLTRTVGSLKEKLEQAKATVVMLNAELATTSTALEAAELERRTVATKVSSGDPGLAGEALPGTVSGASTSELLSTLLGRAIDPQINQLLAQLLALETAAKAAASDGAPGSGAAVAAPPPMVVQEVTPRGDGVGIAAAPPPGSVVPGTAPQSVAREGPPLAKRPCPEIPAALVDLGLAPEVARQLQEAKTAGDSKKVGPGVIEAVQLALAGAGSTPATEWAPFLEEVAAGAEMQE